MKHEPPVDSFWSSNLVSPSAPGVVPNSRVGGVTTRGALDRARKRRLQPLHFACRGRSPGRRYAARGRGLAAATAKSYGEGKLQQYAQDIGVEYPKLKQYRWVWKAYEKGTVTYFSNSWSVHYAFAAQPDRFELERRIVPVGFALRTLAFVAALLAGLPYGAGLPRVLVAPLRQDFRPRGPAGLTLP